MVKNKKDKRREERKDGFRKVAGFAGFVHLVLRFLAGFCGLLEVAREVRADGVWLWIAVFESGEPGVAFSQG